MTDLHFEIAAADDAALNDREYFLTLFTLPGPTADDPDETYAAVRPGPDAWLALSRSVYVAKRSQEDMLSSGMKFLDQCLIQSDLRKALLQAIETDPEKWAKYRPQDDDEMGDPDFSDFAATVVQGNQRLTDRLFDGDDRFGSSTLVDVMQRLVQQWSANPTGSPVASSSSRRTTGGRSTASGSPKASTSSGRSGNRRRAS
jgi:hypothetical protein